MYYILCNLSKFMWIINYYIVFNFISMFILEIVWMINESFKIWFYVYIMYLENCLVWNKLIDL